MRWRWPQLPPRRGLDRLVDVAPAADPVTPAHAVAAAAAAPAGHHEVQEVVEALRRRACTWDNQILLGEPEAATPFGLGWLMGASEALEWAAELLEDRCSVWDAPTPPAGPLSFGPDAAKESPA